MWLGMCAGATFAAAGYGRVIDAIVVGGATSFLSMAADAVLLKLLGDPDEKD